jgi:hypothetical protein
LYGWGAGPWGVHLTTTNLLQLQEGRRPKVLPKGVHS